MFRSKWAERAIGRRVDGLSSARIAAQTETEESLVIPDSPFDEAIRVSHRGGGVHGRREGVQSGNFRRDIGQVGERPGRSAEQVAFLGLFLKDGSILCGCCRVGRLDNRGDCIASHEFALCGFAARFDRRDDGVA